MCLDVSDITAVKERLKDIGHVDLLVNNAGTNVIQNFLDVTEDAYDRYVHTNCIHATYRVESCFMLLLGCATDVL